jgi:23S rRNA pseudouridine955/2504/2580 synthase
MRVDRYFEPAFPGLSFSHIQRIVRKGEVRVNGKRVDTKDRLADRPAGAHSRRSSSTCRSARRFLSPRMRRRARSCKSIILHEDDDVLVLNKPMGLSVQGGSGTTRHLDGMLEVLRAAGLDGQKPRLVHRLDKDTAGCLLVAKTRFAAAALAKTFRSRAARKIYWALVAGVPKPRRGASRPSSPRRSARKTLHARRRARRRGREPRGHLLRGGRDLGADARLGVAQAGHRPHPSAARPHGAYRHPIVGDPKYFQIENWELPGGCRTSCTCWRGASSCRIRAAVRSTSPRRCRRTCSRSWNLLGLGRDALRPDRRGAGRVIERTRLNLALPHCGQIKADLTPRLPSARRYAMDWPAVIAAFRAHALS